jgi:hypothetical protein
MPTKTWELPARQPDSRDRFPQDQSDEPGNFEPARRKNDRDRDASAESERRVAAPEDINTQGSER